MSTKFSSVYDELRTVLSTVFPDRTELNNPYVIEDDSDLMYDSGYTLGIGTGNNSNRVICGKATVRRDFVVILTNRYTAPSRDIPARIAKEKQLLNAQQDLIKYMESNTSSANIVSMSYTSDNGIEFLAGDRFGFLVLQSIVSIEYVEAL